MATNKPRVPVTMEPDLFDQVTAYRRKHGITSQSKAIQQLVRIGISSLEGQKRPIPERRDEPDSQDAQERELIQIARELDPAQKALLLRLLEVAGDHGEKQPS